MDKQGHVITGAPLQIHTIAPPLEASSGNRWLTNQRQNSYRPIFVYRLVVQQFGLVIERSLVRLPVGALSSQLGQLSLPSLRGR